MQYKIHGTVMQILETHLMMGESIYTESGGMAWMKGDIEMKTNTRGGLIPDFSQINLKAQSRDEK
ncbi:MAG: AIM24 family protein [Crocosphaera sp.]|uniref:AIM24 family protein n=1 Tax=Crocosphaera sp. TaxID=2729996 RepID=UPI00257B620D|nr:AIM24 family protein [Crocosphaera sp.]MCH2247799.1 AIM24 family protein [Crocosphaera sp.]